MTPTRYHELRTAVCERGFASDIEWSETVTAPQDADTFAREYIFVVCNSGMKAQIAVVIFRKVMGALERNEHPSLVFGHVAKANAIFRVWNGRGDWFRRFADAGDKVAFLETMPWIGSITKWHLAKNFGVDVVKPDRHLVRVAARYGTSPQDLCAQLALATGDRIATVDTVIWRACNLGLISSAGDKGTVACTGDAHSRPDLTPEHA